MSDKNQYEEQLQLNKEKHEFDTVKKEQNQSEQQENNNNLQIEPQVLQQKSHNNALNNTDVLSKGVVLSSEALDKILKEVEEDEEAIKEKEKEKDTTIVKDSQGVMLGTIKYINKPSYKANKSLQDAKHGEKIKPVDDTEIMQKYDDMEAEKEAEAKKKLESQPKELVENYKELLGFMTEFRSACQRELQGGNSDLMNNLIDQVYDFEKYVNSKEFSVGKQHDYIPKLINMRNSVALYYEKNKGFKWTSKGRRRRELSKNILDRLNKWIGSMPDPIIDDYVCEMEKDEYEKIRDLESSKEMYMELGEAVLRKQWAREGKEGEPKDGYRQYLNPDTVRYMSTLRSYDNNRLVMVNMQPSTEEIKELQEKAIKRHKKSIGPEVRSHGYQWGSVKINYDGSPADKKEAVKIKKIMTGMKAAYADDLEGMKEFFDGYIKSIMDYAVTLEDLTPENIHKKGPYLLFMSDRMMTIENMLSKDSLFYEYLKTLSPAVKYRLERVKYMSGIATVMMSFAQGQQFSHKSKLLTSDNWVKPLDIDKSKALVDFLKKSPEKINEVHLVFSDSVIAEYKYFDKLSEEDKKNKNINKNSNYKIYQDNIFEMSLMDLTRTDTIKGDYYAPENRLARDHIRAELYMKDVPNFSFEHPELEEPICEAYKNLEKVEEKIVGIIKEIEEEKKQNYKDEEILERLERNKAKLNSQREDILREKDKFLEVRNAKLKELKLS